MAYLAIYTRYRWSLACGNVGLYRKAGRESLGLHRSVIEISHCIWYPRVECGGWCTLICANDTDELSL